MSNEPDEGPLHPKARFASLVCPSCRQADQGEIYRKGPDPLTRIRARGDFVRTDDGFFCVNSRLRSLLEAHRVLGVKFKRVGTSGWHVMNVTCRVKHEQGVYRVCKGLDGKKYCSKCNRPTSVAGIHEFESQIDKRARALTIFTTQPPLISGPEMFFAEDVVQILKVAKIKGGMFLRLLKKDEETAYKASVKAGKERLPPHSRIWL